MEKEEGSRRGYQQGMGGKTVRNIRGQVGYAASWAQDKKQYREAKESSSTPTTTPVVATGEWVVVESKKKKKTRNGPRKLDARYTLVDPKKKNYDLHNRPSTDVPQVRKEKKQFLVETEVSTKPPDKITFIGSGALKRGYY